MTAVLSQIRAAILRRRVQTAIVLVICVLGSSVATLALTLRYRSYQPWDEAFAAVNGPHLVFTIDAGRMGKAELAATASLPGVVAAGIPLEMAEVPFKLGAEKASIQLIERSSPGGNVGRVSVIAGRWPQRPGEIALARVDELPMSNALGVTIHAVTGRDTVAFTVVGVVSDLTAVGNLGGTPRGWVVPGQVVRLLDGNQVRLGYQMPYRFQRAATSADLAADRRLVEAALPSGAAMGPPGDWLDMRGGSSWLVTAVSGVIFAFSTFALLAVAVIVAAVVAGVVVSGYRDIGIAKALGFTPVEVALVIVGSMAVPGSVGAIVGVPIGIALSQTFLEDGNPNLNLPAPSSIDPRVDLAVPAGLLLLVALAALIPALRAARTNSLRAIALGAVSGTARRSWLTTALVRVGAPRPLSLGAGDALARPVRAILTLLALAIGVATLTFAFTFAQTTREVVNDRASWGAAQDLNARRYPGLGDGEATTLLASQPETKSVIATRQLPLSIAGHAAAEPLIAMRGDAVAFGYRTIAGRWFAAPGEAVAASLTMRELHLRIGDTVVGIVDDHPVRLRLVGIGNNITTGGRGFHVDWETLAAALPDAAPDQYLIQLRTGTDPQAFAYRVAAHYPDALEISPIPWAQAAEPGLAFFDGLVGGLTLVLALIGVAGVFNATLIATRERAHDLATLKALGMSPMQVVAMTAVSSIVLATVAAIFGMPIGIWLRTVIGRQIGELYGFVPDTPGLSPLTAILVVGGAFVVALAGAALPARSAAVTPAAEILRSE